MSRNRLPSAAQPVRLPQPPAPTPAQGSFILCPLSCPPGMPLEMLQAIYLAAFEQAQAVVRPSLPERDLPGVWN